MNLHRQHVLGIILTIVCLSAGTIQAQERMTEYDNADNGFTISLPSSWNVLEPIPGSLFSAATTTRTGNILHICWLERVDVKGVHMESEHTVLDSLWVLAQKNNTAGVAYRMTEEATLGGLQAHRILLTQGIHPNQSDIVCYSAIKDGRWWGLSFAYPSYQEAELRQEILNITQAFRIH